MLTVLAPTGGALATVDEPPATPPPVTFNEFLPENRGLGECISAVPKPGCGSEARGGWHQTLVFLAIVAGLAIIAWRVVVSARKAKQAQVTETGPPRDRSSTDSPIVPGAPGDHRGP